MAEKLYTQNDRLRSLYNQLIAGSTCCCKVPGCSGGQTTGTNMCISSPTEWDVTFPTISLSSGTMDCGACGTLSGQTFTVINTTDASQCWTGGFPIAQTAQWVYASTGWCAINPPSTATYFETACLGISLTQNCSGAQVNLQCVATLWVPTRPDGSGGLGQSYTWRNTNIEAGSDCDVEVFQLPWLSYSSAFASTDTVCTAATFTGTSMVIQKH